MSTIVASMQQVSLPRFAPATASVPVTAGESKRRASMLLAGHTGADGDPLDFDLLAEYLLDDVAAGGVFPSFNSCTSLEAAEGLKNASSDSDYLTAAASLADPLADAHAQLTAGGKSTDGQPPDIASDLAQVQQMIAAHAARAEASVQSQPDTHHQTVVAPSAQPQSSAAAVLPPASTQAPSPTLPSVAVQAPVAPQHSPPVVPQASVPTSAAQPATAPATAPAQSHPSAAPLMHPGVTMMHNAQNQTTAAPTTLPPMVVHQHGGTVQAPASATGAFNVTTNGTLSGNKRPLQYPMDMQGQRRQKTQAQISRRRERNRILARRTRLRKKFFFESLQKEVTDLQRENNALKEIVKRKLDQAKAVKVLEECRVELPSIVMESCGDATELDRQDFSLIKSLQGSQQCFVITDPSLQDNPIVYASEGFLNTTGYGRDEVLGRNCRFLQGTETSQSKVEVIKKSLIAGEDVSVCLINYTADGTAFWNQLFIAALRDANNNIVNFVGVLVRVSGPGPDDEEYGKLLPGETAQEEDCKVESDEQSNPSDTVEGTVAAITDAVSAAVDAAPVL